MNRVRLTKADIENGNIESAEKRLNDGDDGLARHTTECTLGIDWDQSKIVGQEQDTTQRKMFEGVETIKKEVQGTNTTELSQSHGAVTIYYILPP